MYMYVRRSISQQYDSLVNVQELSLLTDIGFWIGVLFTILE